VAERLRALAPAGLISVSSTEGDTGRRWAPPAMPPSEVEVAPWHRALDRVWRRHSFSSTIAATEEERIISEPEHGAREDERPAGGPPDDDPPDRDGALRAVPLPLTDAPRGVGFGSLVHAVMERWDFAAADAEPALADLLAAEAPRWEVTLEDPASLAGALVAAAATPLHGDLRLCDLDRADRLDELAFELPVAGAGARVTPRAIADLLERRLPADDPLAAYPQHLRNPRMAPALRGHLIGASTWWRACRATASR